MQVWMVEGLRRGCLLLFFCPVPSKSDVPASETNISSEFCIGKQKYLLSCFSLYCVVCILIMSFPITLPCLGLPAVGDEGFYFFI